MKKKILIISLIVLVLDQLSKILIGINIELNSSTQVIKNFFRLTNVVNKGGAFSILNGQRFIFILVGIGALYLIYDYIKEFENNNRNIIAFGLLIGGIIGNLIDRVVYGYVRDFLDFNIFGWNYPVFNIGDIGIFIGVILLIISIIKGENYGSKRKK